MILGFYALFCFGHCFSIVQRQYSCMSLGRFSALSRAVTGFLILMWLPGIPCYARQNALKSVIAMAPPSEGVVLARLSTNYILQSSSYRFIFRWVNLLYRLLYPLYLHILPWNPILPDPTATSLVHHGPDPQAIQYDKLDCNSSLRVLCMYGEGIYPRTSQELIWVPKAKTEFKSPTSMYHLQSSLKGCQQRNALSANWERRSTCQ